MTTGTLVIITIWLYIIIAALLRPWIGVVGYVGFAILCPQWNWRWSLPEFEYQKYIAVATFLGFLINGFQSQRLTRAGIWSFIFFAMYVALMWASSFFGYTPGKTDRFLDITTKIWLMTTLTAFLLDTQNKICWLVWVAVVSQGWNAFNINQLYYELGFFRNDFMWNFLDNNTYSVSSLPIAALAFGILMTHVDWKQRLLVGVIFVLQIHQLMILMSRGTMMGGIALIVIGIFFMPKNRISIGMTVVASTIGMLLAGPSVLEEFNSSFQKEGQLDSSAESRFYLWKAGTKIISDYPLIGVGPWRGELFVPEYYEGGLITSAKALHNLFFEVGTGGGIPCLSCYLLYFIIPWVMHYRLWRIGIDPSYMMLKAVNLAILCGIPGYWVASMFSSGALIESPYTLVSVGCATLAVHSNMHIKTDKSTTDYKTEEMIIDDESQNGFIPEPVR